jgi:hypothetical protein
MDILRGADTDNSGTINYTGKTIYLITFFRIFGGDYGLVNVP